MDKKFEQLVVTVEESIKLVKIGLDLKPMMWWKSDLSSIIKNKPKETVWKLISDDHWPLFAERGAVALHRGEGYWLLPAYTATELLSVMPPEIFRSPNLYYTPFLSINRNGDYVVWYKRMKGDFSFVGYKGFVASGETLAAACVEYILFLHKQKLFKPQTQTT